MLADGRIVIVGGDALALSVCAELAAAGTRPVAILWHDEGDLEARTLRCGATFVRLRGDERESLLAAGVVDASAVVAITDDDAINLHFALQARDSNPAIRVVLRQFNRTLGRKIEQNLDNSAVISLSSHAAATYAAAAMDRTCYRGIQFPDIDGPLAGFFELPARAAGIAGLRVREAVAKTGRRVLAVDDEVFPDGDRVLTADDRVTLFGLVRARKIVKPALVPHVRVRQAARALRQLDPVARGAIVVAALLLAAGAVFFGHALRLDPLTAVYFTLTTMTTTGYGDISPRDAGPTGMVAAICLMIGGIVFSGVLIAMLSAIFTQARYDAVHGLRRITGGGHVILCGSGNVGSRVLDFLERLECRVVVIEQNPRPEIVEGSRERRYELLTGDATRDVTLDLCAIESAVAVVALTQNDTMNLEVALGARARNATLPVVMRVQHETFERSVRSHFHFRLTFGTATLAASAIAGLVASDGARGYVGIGNRAYELAEMRGGEAVGAAGCVALACRRGDTFHLVERFEDAHPHELVLYLRPLERVPGSVRNSNDR